MQDGLSAYSCMHCMTPFSYEESVKQHMKKKHPELWEVDHKGSADWIKGSLDEEGKVTVNDPEISMGLL